MRRASHASYEKQTTGGLLLLLVAVVTGSALQMILMPHDAQAVRSAAPVAARLSRSAAPGPSVPSVAPRVPVTAPAAKPAVIPAVSTRILPASRSTRAALATPASETAAASIKLADERTVGPRAARRDDSAAPRMAPIAVTRFDEPPAQTRLGSRPAAREATPVRVVSVVAPERASRSTLPPPGSAAQGQETEGDTEAGPSDDGEDQLAGQDSTPDPDSGGMQMLLLGPTAAHGGQLITYSIVLEDGRNIGHSPLRITYNPEVLQFIDAQEGPLLSSDGASTQFVAKENVADGLVDIAVSRMPPARGISGSGVLCTITFLARAPGESPLLATGSRLLDSTGHRVAFRGNDAHVAVQP